MKHFVTLLLCLCMAMSVCLITSALDGSSALSTDKTVYYHGEPINVTAVQTVSDTDWFGIVPADANGNPVYTWGSIMWKYVSDAGSGVTTPVNYGFNKLSDSSFWDDCAAYMGCTIDEMWTLPAGNYCVVYVTDDKGITGGKNVEECIKITVIPRLSTNKTTYRSGEDILFTAYGTGKDWVGISKADNNGLPESHSIRYKYICEGVGNAADGSLGSGSGVQTKINDGTVNYAEYASLPSGDYVLYVVENDQTYSSYLPYTCIKITVAAEKPPVPKSVEYKLTDKTTGHAEGTVTVTFDKSVMSSFAAPTHVELYWGDENGNALSGYNQIGKRKLTGATTEIAMTKSMIIPEDAKKLMVSAYNSGGTSAAVAATLPSDRTYLPTGELVSFFQIVSDLHVSDGDYVTYDRHAAMMFEDVLTLEKELGITSAGIFVSGDSADQGQIGEYEMLFGIWEKSGISAKLYLAMGNHELMSGEKHLYNYDYPVQSTRFMEYANRSLAANEKISVPYYYLKRGGQHFIFLATEYCGTHAYLSDTQLAWLENKLNEVASRGAPVFILLHQPAYNTIAGSLASEDDSKRQDWNGVIAGDYNFNYWLNHGSPNDKSKLLGQYEKPFRDILAKYPSAMVFSGHSHWNLESLGNIYEASAEQPNYMLNTASVGYLWTDNDELNSGTHLYLNELNEYGGSQGYHVFVYENCIEFRGRNFESGEWVSAANYRIRIKSQANKFDVNYDGSLSLADALYLARLTVSDTYESSADINNDGAISSLDLLLLLSELLK